MPAFSRAGVSSGICWLLRDGIPGVAETGGAAQRGPLRRRPRSGGAIAAGEGGRSRFEADVLAVEARVVLGPQGAAGSELFVGDRAAVVERGRVQGFELLAHPAGADPGDHTAARRACLRWPASLPR